MTSDTPTIPAEEADRNSPIDVLELIDGEAVRPGDFTQRAILALSPYEVLHINDHIWWVLAVGAGQGIFTVYAASRKALVLTDDAALSRYARDHASTPVTRFNMDTASLSFRARKALNHPKPRLLRRQDARDMRLAVMDERYLVRCPECTTRVAMPGPERAPTGPWPAHQCWGDEWRYDTWCPLGLAPTLEDIEDARLRSPPTWAAGTVGGGAPGLGRR